MGAKSSNAITKKEMLPLFQVISDLEKPPISNSSLQTNFSSPIENSLIFTENDDFVLCTYNKAENEVCSSDHHMDKHILEHDEVCFSEISQIDCIKCKTVRESGRRRRNKKRRRLKKSERYPKHIHKEQVEMHIHDSQPKNKESMATRQYQESKKSQRNLPIERKSKTTTDNEIHSSISDDEKFLSNIEKRRTGMFTTMAINMYQDDNIDLSRHFKDLTEEEFTTVPRSDKKKRKNPEFPIYEVPNDIIDHARNLKKRKKKKLIRKQKKPTDNDEDTSNIKEDSSDRIVSDCSKKLRVSKKEIIKKYEHMFGILLQKAEQKDSIIQEKEYYLTKMKNKLKQVLDYNNQFADENVYMKRQHDDMKVCIEQYKNYVHSLEEQLQHNTNIKKSDAATNQDVCPRCSVIEITAIKIERDNIKLNEDILMLKNVVFRLNVQLSRYQEKLRSVTKSFVSNRNKLTKANMDCTTIKQKDEGDTRAEKQSQSREKESNDDLSLPSLPIFSNTPKTSDILDDGNQKWSSVNVEVHMDDSNQEEKDPLTQQKTDDTYTVEYEACTAWGDVNTHTLAPLLNAYQESLTEKDDLIRDYEREFNRFTSKLKQIISENDNLHSNSSKMASELISLRETCGMATKERDDLRKENYTSKERVSELEKKLKEIHEYFEQKVESMSRDYNLIHQEYFKTKTGLAAAQGRCQAFEDQHKTLQGEKLVPAKVHAMKIDEFKKLFDDLKNRYELDKSKLSTRVTILEENNILLEKKHLEACNEKHNLELKAKTNEKLIRRYRQAVLSYRKELTALKTSRDIFKRRADRATNLCRQMVLMLEQTSGDDRFQHLKAETLSVQKEALKELDALEVRMKEQDLTLEKVKEENVLEIAKLKDWLKEKDATIEAMSRHIRGERLKRFSGHTIPGTNLPIEFARSKIEMKPTSIGSMLKLARPEFSSAPSISTKGGHYLSKEKVTLKSNE